MAAQFSVETKVLAAFAAAALVVAALAVAAWKVSRDAVEAALQVSHTHEVLDSLAEARADTHLIELSTQNYRITGAAAALAERDAAISARETSLRRLRELTADNARQQERWMRLREVADERLAISRRTVLLRETEGPEAANAYVASAPLRETRQRLLRTLREMEDEEHRLLQERGARQIRMRGFAVAASTLAALALAVLLLATYVLIRRQLRAIEASRRALEAVNRELESFSYSVSHDLRAPLRAIDGFSQMLEEDHAGRLDGEGLRLLGVIRENSRKMDALINDLLAFSRLSRRPLTVAEVDMSALLAEVLRDLEAAHGGALPRIVIGELPPARGDRVLLRQVWANLLSNAVKFSRNAPAPKIEVGADRGEAGPVYWVKDNGAGFDMQYYNKLFAVFQRLHNADEFPGTGVGLAIVHRIVTRHGGRVWAQGKVNQGATFYFTLA